MLRGKETFDFSGEAVSTPAVSVLIAAYNSSARLRCAVTSVLHQSYTDLEVVVVGDCCTDDSEMVLMKIGDSRIRWENLSRNWGEQSVPSNRGIELARGEFVFFLNQDDLWLPNHIEDCLEFINDNTLDALWSPYVVLPPGHRPGQATKELGQLKGMGRQHPEYDPLIFIPASATAWRIASIRGIGGWRTAAEVTVSPSQDLLWRAKRHGLSIRGKDNPTVLVLWSGSRPGSYQPSYLPEDNKFWLEALENKPDFVRQEIGRIPRQSVSSRSRTGQQILKAIKPRILIRKTISLLGWHPLSFEAWLKNRSSGGFINRIRSLNNLERIDFRNRKRKATEI